ncbi:hypothetical protein QTP88_015411 [Uroleucon formosanum]
MRPGCKQRSVVWESFRKNFDGKVVTCQVRKKEFKYFGNTTNLKEHLKRMHPFKLNTVPGNEDDPSDQLQTINNASGPSTSSASFISPSQSVTSKQCSEPPSKRPRQLKLFGSTKNELTETEIKEIDKCVVKMIVSDYQPLSIVENVGFLEYTKKLQPLYSVPKLSGENYPTISLVIPLIRGLQYMLKNFRTETTIGIEFKNKLIDVVGRRLGNLEKDKIVAKSTLLDPRLKKTAFGLQENADNAHKWIREELTNKIRAKNDNTEITESDTTQSTSSANICSVWKHFDDKVAQVKITSNPNATASIMIRQYLEIPPLDRKKIL